MDSFSTTPFSFVVPVRNLIREFAFGCLFVHLVSGFVLWSLASNFFSGFPVVFSFLSLTTGFCGGSVFWTFVANFAGDFLASHTLTTACVPLHFTMRCTRLPTMIELATSGFRFLSG